MNRIGTLPYTIEIDQLSVQCICFWMSTQQCLLDEENIISNIKLSRFYNTCTNEQG